MTKKKKYYQPKLKWRKERDPFPDDFWNYKLNPIVGYYVDLAMDDNGVETERKYNMITKSIPPNTA